MAASAFPGGGGREDRGALHRPLHLQDLECAKMPAMAPEAETYASACNSKGEFSATALQEIATAGTLNAEKVGGLVQAARQLRELQLGSSRYARNFTESKHHLYRDIASEFLAIYTKPIDA